MIAKLTKNAKKIQFFFVVFAVFVLICGPS